MISVLVSCDFCTAAKAQANGWWCLLPSTAGERFGEPVRMHDVAEDLQAGAGVRHFCSQGCLMKVFQQWMDERGREGAAAAAMEIAEAEAEVEELKTPLCPACAGQGSEFSQGYESTCRDCGGTGQVQQ